MDHSVWVGVGLSSGRVMFGLSDISGRFGLSVWVGYGSVRVNFGSINFWSNTLFIAKQATL